MSDYKQPTYEQRCQIEILNKSGFSEQAVTEAIGGHQSSVARQLRHNNGERG